MSKNRSVSSFWHTEFAEPARKRSIRRYGAWVWVGFMLSDMADALDRPLFRHDEARPLVMVFDSYESLIDHMKTVIMDDQRDSSDELRDAAELADFERKALLDDHDADPKERGVLYHETQRGYMMWGEWTTTAMCEHHSGCFRMLHLMPWRARERARYHGWVYRFAAWAARMYNRIPAGSGWDR